jgi:hypothetical protein
MLNPALVEVVKEPGVGLEPGVNGHGAHSTAAGFSLVDCGEIHGRLQL